MKKRKKKIGEVEFRYYELPLDAPLLARMGEAWKGVYGRDAKDRHFHNLLEIGYCHYGTGKLMLGEDERDFAGNMVSVIPPNYLHNTVSDEGVDAYWEYLFVDVEKLFSENRSFSVDKVEGLTKSVHKKALFRTEEENPVLIGLIKSILEELRSGQEFYMESVRGLLLAALMEVVRVHSVAEERTVTLKEGSARISPALFYISENYAGDIRIGELADACHMSETHFRRVFVRYMNMTPIEYLNLVRIRMACELLNKTEESMEEIAQKIGFETCSTFNRNFRKLLGTSPYQWKIHPENYEHNLINYKVSAHRGW